MHRLLRWRNAIGANEDATALHTHSPGLDTCGDGMIAPERSSQRPSHGNDVVSAHQIFLHWSCGARYALLGAAPLAHDAAAADAQLLYAAPSHSACIKGGYRP
jgi:hypothetical protein